ncbi:MAG: rhomboid family intramembrane serine protease [Planctomycetota bacterium]
MGTESRDYLRDEARRYSGGGGGLFGRLGSHSVVTWLLGINFVVFVWESIFGTAMRGSFLALGPVGFFSVDTAVYGGQVWRFLTYQFLHGGFLHLLFNMIGLFFFGPMLEQWWGSRRFLAYYLLCGVSGAVVASLLGAVPGLGIFPVGAALIGASGAVFGILAGCAVLFPHQRVQLLFPPIPMTMRTMALIFLAISALGVIAGSANAGGDAAHLGGALLGFALTKKAGLLNWADRVSPGAITGAPGAVRDKVNAGRSERKLARERADEAEVDRILAKVAESGLHSLTAKEKKTLNRATESKRAG